MFNFSGDIILSKSWLNRAQIIYHFANEKFPFSSLAADVRSLKKAIATAGSSAEYQLGQGGTGFRFFVFLISRLPGKWKVYADKQLLNRPQQPLLTTLKQFGVTCVPRENHFEIESKGWGTVSHVSCDAGLSSQFVSGLLLSCWQLESDLNVVVPKPVKSEEYLKLTLQMLEVAGMKITVTESNAEISYFISKQQKPHTGALRPEADLSSAFSLAAAAVVNGSVEIKNWPAESLQPDREFLTAFQKMNIDYSLDANLFKVAKHKTWNGCEMNISHAPDLFPVLSALCALAEGKSQLIGGEHLRVKESDRLAKTAELLKLCGVHFEEIQNGLVIYGQSFDRDITKRVVFDPSHDHRMAMAAAVFKLRGFNIEILHPECVEKSYPGFWKDVGL